MDPWITLPSNLDNDLCEIGLMLATSPEFADAFLRALTAPEPTALATGAAPGAPELLPATG
jgi:hypothetical protein